MQYYTLEHLQSVLTTAGLAVLEMFGSVTGTPYSDSSGAVAIEVRRAS